jgi:hypothetical protein
MATQEYFETVTPKQLLDRIRRAALFGTDSQQPLFRVAELRETGEAVSQQLKEPSTSCYIEWSNYKKAVTDTADGIAIIVLPEESLRFKKDLQDLEESYLDRSLINRDRALQDMILLGQELLRRKYFALMLHPACTIHESSVMSYIIETGAVAIQILGRAPAGPRYPFRKFNRSGSPKPDTLGIEILSSGAFPDWFDPLLADLRHDEKYSRMGFENVLAAALDTPRSRVLRQIISDGDDISPLKLPLFQRMMLDLELMRLGQATTPGTYTMLLNSFYYGALVTDHSTNVSEQVQIIYEEENWKPVYVLDAAKDPEQQALEAATVLLEDYFRFKADSIIHRDHPREARIQFSINADSGVVIKFFSALMRMLKAGIVVKGRRLPKIAAVHKIIPVAHLHDEKGTPEKIKNVIDTIKAAGLKEFYLMADCVHHSTGMLQYFDSAQEVNSVILYAKAKRVRIIDGRSVDMVATANKAVEAAAGAIESGQGCIKIGLLGLTVEQMKDFIRRVKKGLDASHKRQDNQLLVFIGIIDRPLVTADKVYEKAIDTAKLFIDLMKTTRHDILLIDTMDKGAKDHRLVDAGDSKGGHFTFAQIESLTQRSRRAKCDLWVAGSYTEEQVYKTAMSDPKKRPSLICLGGAERSFGGLRLDPREAYSPEDKSKEEKKLSLQIEYDADIKFILSRENKLARDAGHVVGELKRRGNSKWKKIHNLRTEYMTVRDGYFNYLDEVAKKRQLSTRNIDTLILHDDEVLTSLSPNEKRKIKRLRSSFEKYREHYVGAISTCLMDLFKKEWFLTQNEHKKK